ncbi:TonB-dependent receptor plug domain-containing protein, partial [Escherichia coli]|uniref:TonB-dependent receptor plug domain-containing protein n=1 Tax=Escherichia coli TaxID=562 RepID=UPI002119E9C3
VSALGIEREARSLGYSVASASADELTENRTPRLMDALNGKLAGVSITPLGTGPQGSTKVRIRGQSSLGNNNSPLIVVNGIP